MKTPVIKIKDAKNVKVLREFYSFLEFKSIKDEIEREYKPKQIHYSKGLASNDEELEIKIRENLPKYLLGFHFDNKETKDFESF